MDETNRHQRYYAETDAAPELTAPLARSLRDSKASVTYRWLERIKERVEVEAADVFPSEELLDHVPLLIEAIAEFMEDPSEEGTASDSVMAKAAELGEMRFEQGFSTYQVLKEFEILGGVILSHIRARVTELGFTPKPDDVVTISHRVHRALSKVQQGTAARHIALLEERRHDLDQRLRLVRDMLESLEPHVADMLDGKSDPRAGVVLAGRIQDLRELTSTGLSSRRRGVPLRGAVREAVRRVRPIAAESDFEVEIDEPLPPVEVPEAQVEQCLIVYLTNALRHCHPVDGQCRVEVAARMEADGERVVVRVRNTGRVVEHVDDITELGSAEEAVDGRPGVGLRFARDVMAAVGGRTWAEPASDPAGAIFALSIPARRDDDEGRKDAAEDS